MISRKACSTVRRSGHDVDGNVADSSFTNTSPWKTPMVFLVQYFLKTVDIFHGDLLGLPEGDPGKFETKKWLD